MSRLAAALATVRRAFLPRPRQYEVLVELSVGAEPSACAVAIRCTWQPGVSASVVQGVLCEVAKDARYRIEREAAQRPTNGKVRGNDDQRA